MFIFIVGTLHWEKMLDIAVPRVAPVRNRRYLVPLIAVVNVNQMEILNLHKEKRSGEMTTFTTRKFFTPKIGDLSSAGIKFVESEEDIESSILWVCKQCKFHEEFPLENESPILPKGKEVEEKGSLPPPLFFTTQKGKGPIIREQDQVDNEENLLQVADSILPSYDYWLELNRKLRMAHAYHGFLVVKNEVYESAKRQIRSLVYSNYINVIVDVCAMECVGGYHIVLLLCAASHIPYIKMRSFEWSTLSITSQYPNLKALCLAAELTGDVWPVREFDPSKADCFVPCIDRLVHVVFTGDLRNDLKGDWEDSDLHLVISNAVKDRHSFVVICEQTFAIEQEDLCLSNVTVWYLLHLWWFKSTWGCSIVDHIPSDEVDEERQKLITFARRKTEKHARKEAQEIIKFLKKEPAEEFSDFENGFDSDVESDDSKDDIGANEIDIGSSSASVKAEVDDVYNFIPGK